VAKGQAPFVDVATILIHVHEVAEHNPGYGRYTGFEAEATDGLLQQCVLRGLRQQLSVDVDEIAALPPFAVDTA